MAGACTRTGAISLVGILLQLTGLVLFVLGFFPVKPALTGISDAGSVLPGCHTSNSDKGDGLGQMSYQEASGIPQQHDRLIIMLQERYILVPSVLFEVSEEWWQLVSAMMKVMVRPGLKVVDGLPAEFLLGRGGRPPPLEMVAAMPYTQSLLSAGRAYGYRAKAAPPTVTMPRLKAMTSGAIAGFLDVAFNFNTQALLDDNLIGQLARSGWRMVMLGDDTWLKLFPNIFMRHDGVNSFYIVKIVNIWAHNRVILYTPQFGGHEVISECWQLVIANHDEDLGPKLCVPVTKVRDTIEVDQNVTRHLETELAATDWDLLVLHYLGLDHVGHLGGRSSSLMAPKLKEMDAVIQRIHHSVINSSTSRRTLLMVGSDHGMTDGGNHGGASYQESDALALFVPGQENFVPFLDSESDAATSLTRSSFQVDVVPTLSLQLGVPIPKNSVGVLLPQLFTTLPPKEQLRALELNSWQLFRLLRVRSPASPCIISLCSNQQIDYDTSSSQASHFWNGETNKDIENFCSLFNRAIKLHKSWRLKLSNGAVSEEKRLADVETVREAYMDFLHPASEWLARGTTEKHIVFLISGGSFMLLSTVSLIWVLLYIYKVKSLVKHKDQSGFARSKGHKCFTLEELVAVGGVCIHAGSLASSSMVEEEQYTNHFLVSTLSFALIRRTLQLQAPTQIVSTWHLWKLPAVYHSTKKKEVPDGLHQPAPEQKQTLGTKTLTQAPHSEGVSQCYIISKIVAIGLVLFTGRLLRAWHRSGVNWTHLPDIAKWLDEANPTIPLTIRYTALCFVAIIGFLIILLPSPEELLRRGMVFCMSISAALIFIYVKSTTTGRTTSADTVTNLVARAVFGILGGTSLLAFLVFPWVIPLPQRSIKTEEQSVSSRDEKKSTTIHGKSDDCWEGCALEAGIQSAIESVGRVLISCWCLLQLLLQQTVNAGPIALLMVQLLAILTFFRRRGTQHGSWLPVLTLQWIGLSGHFGLGNSNTLATVDVAGAYIGLSSHSTFLSGLLAFVITYASPFLFMLGMLLVTFPLPTTRFKNEDPDKQRISEAWLLEAIAVPCVLPLALNGVILVAFTAVLTLMQNHLFVWSVFSPKYLYVCAATVCTTLGAFCFAITGLYSSFVISQRAHWLRHLSLNPQKGGKMW